jgi:hypothetical protein
MTARDWLRQNGYEDVAALIDRVMAEIAAAGSRQRRNWWDTLAGGKGGGPVTVNGHEFPVLRVAQIRQGKAVTPKALCRNPHEQPPDVIATARWPRKNLPSRARRLNQKVKSNQAANHAKAS